MEEFINITSLVLAVFQIIFSLFAFVSMYDEFRWYVRLLLVAPFLLTGVVIVKMLF